MILALLPCHLAGHQMPCQVLLGYKKRGFGKDMLVIFVQGFWDSLSTSLKL